MMCSARSLGSASSSAARRGVFLFRFAPRRRVPASGRIVTRSPSTRHMISGDEPTRHTGPALR